jgi:hypothetical protein
MNTSATTMKIERISRWKREHRRIVIERRIPMQVVGFVSMPRLGGLHHRYDLAA